MNILVGCEKDCTVRDSFRSLGHNAISVDLLESSKGPEDQYHFQQDILDFNIIPGMFDLGIFFPSCTYLCKAQQYLVNKSSDRGTLQKKAIEFVRRLWELPIKRIAIENPPGILTKKFRPPEQLIHPYYFGDPYRKEIQLWLKNLPPLQYNPNILRLDPVTKLKSVHYHTNSRMSQGQKTEIHSSWKYFPRLAIAMAEQWSK